MVKKLIILCMMIFAAAGYTSEKMYVNAPQLSKRMYIDSSELDTEHEKFHIGDLGNKEALAEAKALANEILKIQNLKNNHLLIFGVNSLRL